MSDFTFFAVGVAIMVLIVVVKQITTPEEKATARVIRKGDMANTERKSWVNFRNVGGRISPSVNINLNRIVVFQNTQTGENIELEVSAKKYDGLEQGKIYTLRHRFGVLKSFEVENE